MTVLGNMGLSRLVGPRLSLTLSACSVNGVDKVHSFGMQKSFAAALGRVSELCGAQKFCGKRTGTSSVWPL